MDQSLLEGGSLWGRRPGPQRAPYRLLLEEREKIREVARLERYVDLNHRQLAIVASGKEVVEASASLPVGRQRPFIGR